MNISFTTKFVKNQFPKLGAIWQDGADYVIYQEAQETITDAKTNYVPVVSGDLRNSAYIDEPKRSSGTYSTIRFGFGKSGSPGEKYALRVHELPRSAGQGKNKYLEKPVLKRTGRGYEQRIGDAFRRWLERNL